MIMGTSRKTPRGDPVRWSGRFWEGCLAARGTELTGRCSDDREQRDPHPDGKRRTQPRDDRGLFHVLHMSPPALSWLLR